jgi:putative DNA primase/helicase
MPQISQYDAERQFIDAMRRHGVVLGHEHLLADGHIHRCHVAGKEASGKLDGAYALHLNPNYAYGGFQNWTNGQGWQDWKFKRPGWEPSAEERKQMERDIEQARNARERELAEERTEARKKANGMWQGAEKAWASYPYCQRKRVKPADLRIYRFRNGDEVLCVPIHDEDEYLVSLQLIDADGHKHFLDGGRKQGCHYWIGWRDQEKVICICEGRATGEAIYAATRYSVVIAFDAGNLKAVAQWLRERYPEHAIILCADDDWRTKGNPGLDFARDAARAVNGKVAVPVFGEGREDKWTDFNDMLLAENNHERALDSIEDAIANAVPPDQIELEDGEGSTPGLPVIKVVSGEIARAVDEAQDAILAARLNIFVRGGGVLVEPREREKEAADKRRVKTTILVMTPKPRLAYLINKRAAAFEKYDGRRNDWVRIDPPDKVTEMLLTLGDWKFPEVTGVVSAPTLRPDGSILSQYGYDPATRLWCDSTLTLPDIPERPSRSWAEKSLQLYKGLLAGFPFVSKVDRAVALSAIMTTVLRGAYSLVPLFLIVAHDPGTGKSYLVDVIASIITGRWCPVITPGKDSEEMEKRLGAVLLEGGAIVSLDNLDFNLEGAMLNQMLSQPLVKVRPLGQSAVPECEWRGTLFATGNNVRAVGDLVRRVFTCNMDAKMERPELRRFEFKPITRVLNNRASFIAAAIIIARAYRASNRPASNCVSLGGYEDWSSWAREPLLWLGEADPVESMDAARVSDPARAAARELLERWRRVIGIGKAVSVRRIIGIANEDNRNGLHRYPEFRSFLIEHAGTMRGDGIDPVRLGRWLQAEHGRVYDGLRIDVLTHKGRVNDYVLTEMDEARVSER